MTRIAPVVVLLMCCGCRTDESGDRVILDTLRVVNSVQSGPRDTFLLHPRLLAVRNDQVILFDQGRHAIEAFSDEGELRWVAGRRGGGPQEFAGVTGLSVGPDGEIAVLDQRNGRVTRLTSSGSFLESVPLPDSLGLADRILALGGGRLLVARQRQPVVLEMGIDGAIARKVRHPWSGYDRLPGLATYFLPLALADGGIALVHYYGGAFSVLDEAYQPRIPIAWFVEDVPFPEVEVRVTNNRRVQSLAGATLAAMHATTKGDLLAVLAAGESDRRGRLIDLYRLGDGRYLGSWALPGAARYIAFLGDTVVAISHDPEPALWFLSGGRTPSDSPLD